LIQAVGEEVAAPKLAKIRQDMTEIKGQMEKAADRQHAFALQDRADTRADKRTAASDARMMARIKAEADLRDRRDPPMTIVGADGQILNVPASVGLQYEKAKIAAETKMNPADLRRYQSLLQSHKELNTLVNKGVVDTMSGTITPIDPLSPIGIDYGKKLKAMESELMAIENKYGGMPRGGADQGGGAANPAMDAFNEGMAGGKPKGTAKDLDTALGGGAAAPSGGGKRPFGAPGKKFNPEGDDYDYESAMASGINPDASQHWPSLAPLKDAEAKRLGLPSGSGLVLKGAGHPTHWKTLEVEAEAGNRVIKKGNRY